MEGQQAITVETVRTKERKLQGLGGGWDEWRVRANRMTEIVFPWKQVM